MQIAWHLFRQVDIAASFELPGLLLTQQAQLALALDRAGDRDQAVALAKELLPQAERLGMGEVAHDCRRILDRTP